MSTSSIIKPASQPLEYYKTNSHPEQTCGVCKEPIVSDGLTGKHLAHKKVNLEYIREIWKIDQAPKNTVDAFCDIAHECIKKNPKLMKDVIPKDYAKKSETLSCRFHVECIKGSLATSTDCPSCQTELTPPKGLLSFKDKCLQKVRKKISDASKTISPYCSASSLKKTVKTGLAGAMHGVTCAAGLAMAKITGATESPLADLKELFEPDVESAKTLNLIMPAIVYSTASSFAAHMFVLWTKGEGMAEADEERRISTIAELEKQINTPGVPPAEKLRLKDEIEKHKTRSKDIIPTISRAAFLTAMVGVICLSSCTPYGLTASVLGALAGGILSTEQLSQIGSGVNQLMDQVKGPLIGIGALVGGGLLAGSIGAAAGLPEEAQVIAAGFGAGAASSFAQLALEPAKIPS